MGGGRAHVETEWGGDRPPTEWEPPPPPRASHPRAPPAFVQCMTAVGSANQARPPGRPKCAKSRAGPPPMAAGLTRQRTLPGHPEGSRTTGTHGPSRRFPCPQPHTRTHGASSAVGGPATAGRHFALLLTEEDRLPLNATAAAVGPRRLIRPRNLCIVATGPAVGGTEMAPVGGGPSLEDDDGGWLCREPAVLLPPPPCLCLSRPRGPDQGAGSGTEKRPPLSPGHVEIGDDARRWGQKQPSPLPWPPATAHSQLWLGSAEGGCPGGTAEPPSLDRPLQAHASNVDAWLLGRHRPSTSRHGRGGAVSSSQLVGLAREHGVGSSHPCGSHTFAVSTCRRPA